MVKKKVVELEEHQKTRLNISSGSPQEGIFGYSRAVRFGNHIHVSGTCAPIGNEDMDAYGQAVAALAIIGKALGDAGASFENVVRTVVYVTDMNDAPLLEKAHYEAFGQVRPATSVVQIVRLFRPWQRVEIETYAIV